MDIEETITRANNPSLLLNRIISGELTVDGNRELFDRAVNEYADELLPDGCTKCD